MKIIFLFGAGASFGSGDIRPYPPPLSCDLFSKLMSTFPSSWGAFPWNVRSKFIENFEDGMDRIWSNYSSSVSILMQEMGMYFSQFTPDQENLYLRLLRILKNDDLLEDCLISTINYDCLIEIAASKIGIGINYFSDQESSNYMPILKLHGSCNFISSSINATRGISFTRGIVFGGGIKSIQPNKVQPILRGNTSLPPVMSIFTRGKPLQVSPDEILALQEIWKQSIFRAEKVIIVGVNPNLEDKHIWDPLSETDAKIHYIGNKKRFDEYSKRKRKDKRNNFISNRFKEGFNDILKVVS